MAASTLVRGARSARRRGAERLPRTPAATSARRVVCVSAAAYGVFFALAAVFVYLSFQERRYDLGNMTQAVWSTAHGRFLGVTDDAGRQTTRLQNHVDPFLALFAPLWWLWSSPLLLLTAQAAAVASGAAPVYKLAQKHLRSPRAAAFVAIGYLLFPGTQFNAFSIANGPHAVSFAIPLILWAIWFLDEERLVPFAIFAVLAASTKEEIPIAVGCLGVWYAFRKRQKRVGAGIFATGVAATAVNFLVVIPHFGHGGVSPFASRYAGVGGTPSGILKKSVTDPLALVHAVTTTHKLIYLVLLLVPFLGLWLFEPLLALGAVPDLAINLLSSRAEQTSLHFQYTAGIVPFLVAATILGAERVKRDSVRRDPARLAVYILAAAVVMAPYSPAWYFADLRLNDKRPAQALHRAKAHALRQIPTGAAVTATNQLAGYLSARRSLVLFPHVDGATWAVVDARDHTTVTPNALGRALSEIDADPRWELIYASQGIQVLRKRVN
jgi:uncharacterized membrane protein